MSRKLEGNGLWESSRMILPEHKERIRLRRKELGRRQRPELDPMERERQARLLAESAAKGTAVCVTLFGEFGDRKLTGVVTHTDAVYGRIRLRTDDGEEWQLKVRDLVDVEPVSSGFAQDA